MLRWLLVVLLLVWAAPAFGQPTEWRVYYPLQVKHRWTYVSSDPKAAQTWIDYLKGPAADAAIEGRGMSKP